MSSECFFPQCRMPALMEEFAAGKPVTRILADVSEKYGMYCHRRVA